MRGCPAATRVHCLPRHNAVVAAAVVVIIIIAIDVVVVVAVCAILFVCYLQVSLPSVE